MLLFAMIRNPTIEAKIIMNPSYVLFPVPEHRVAEIASYLYPEASGAELQAQEETSISTPISVEQRNELLARIYVESEPPFRALLMLLANRGEVSEPMYYGDILDAHPEWSSSRSVAGAMGAFSRRAEHRYGGYWPFDRAWDEDEWSHYLTMEVDVAAFLFRLHAERQLPLDR